MLHSPTIIDEIETRLRSVDALLIPHGFLTDLPYLDLWRDHWLIVASDTNERAAQGITMELMAESPWVFTYQSRTAFTSATRQLQQLGIEPRVDAVVESFLSLPHFIAGTDRLGLIQSGLGAAALGQGGIRLFEPPFDATPVLNALWWHPVHTRDPEHAWMRSLFAEAAAGMPAPGAARADTVVTHSPEDEGQSGMTTYSGLDGRTIVITGAARGQGAREALLLAASGARVIATDLLDAPPPEFAGTTIDYRRMDVVERAGLGGPRGRPG